MFQSPDSRSCARPGLRRVLVVDDEPTLRLGFAYALQGGRTHVDTAAGGASALEIAAIHRYDALFLDLRMPDVDGLKVIKSLRRAGNGVPVVLCSAFVTLESLLAAIRHGVVDFLVKPVSPADLRYALDVVTAAPDSPRSRAMALARAGRTGEAARLLRHAASLRDDPAAELWLSLLDHVAAGRPAGELRGVVGNDVAARIALRAGNF